VPLTVRPLAGKADKRRFVDYAFARYADDPHWVPPLKAEVHGLITPGENPWFEHGEAEFFLAERDGRVVGRVSAQIDRLVLDMPAAQGGGRDVGQWGMFEADDADVAAALIATAEGWLAARGVHRAVGPISISIWDEPGLLVKGHDHSPSVMMGHHRPEYQAWIEAAGYAGIKDLYTYELDITKPLPALVQRIVQSGERNQRISVRHVDKRRFAEEAALILGLLNDAWSGNWGFVPLTASEIEYVGKKLKPIVFNDLIRVAEVEGEPVAFMITLPDINEFTRHLNGRLFPFGWAKLLWWLRHPKVRTMRVPLMGVRRRLQATRLASQLAFMMIEYTRRDAVSVYGSSRTEIGWILDDNQGMNAIAMTIDAEINKIYRVYARAI
jgi:hypothetical protein